MTGSAAVRKQNVWLASYPKSGNTWMRIALTSLLNGGGGVDLNGLQNGIGAFLALRSRLDRALDVDTSDLSPEEINRLRPQLYGFTDTGPGEVAIWKVHDGWSRTVEGAALFPASVTAAALYLVRDPRDVAISFAHHFDMGIDAAIEIMADPDYWVAVGTKSAAYHLPQFYSSWSQHVLSWLDASGLDPLVIRYETMTADLAGVLQKVTAVLGWECRADVIAGAVAATAFGRLRRQEETAGFAESPRGGSPFFRRGVAGGWRDTLTAVQRARIERDHGAVMQRLGYL